MGIFEATNLILKSPSLPQLSSSDPSRQSLNPSHLEDKGTQSPEWQVNSVLVQSGGKESPEFGLELIKAPQNWVMKKLPGLGIFLHQFCPALRTLNFPRVPLCIWFSKRNFNLATSDVLEVIRSSLTKVSALPDDWSNSSTVEICRPGKLAYKFSMADLNSVDSCLNSSEFKSSSLTFQGRLVKTKVILTVTKLDSSSASWS